jgi:hypothetical protein
VGHDPLYASIELGVQAMFSGVKARDIVAKTLRRAAFILVVAAIIAAAIAVTTVGSLLGAPLRTNEGVAVRVRRSCCSCCRTSLRRRDRRRSTGSCRRCAPLRPCSAVDRDGDRDRRPDSALRAARAAADRGERVLRDARDGVRGPRLAEPDSS